MTFEENETIPRKEQITVSKLFELLRERAQTEIDILTDEKINKEHFVTESALHRPGLALAGYVKLFTHQRVQIIGNTETRYLENLSKKQQRSAFKNLTQFDVPVIFLTDSNSLPDHLLNIAKKAEIPVAKTSLGSTRFMHVIRDFLQDQFALQTMVHGTMVDVYGIGILITGKSGIGKSEVALDLVERGHRLVADDAVILTKKNNVLMGSATETNKHFMEIRGLGIIDIMSMFGVRAIRYQKRLEIVLELSLWDESTNIERTGLNRETASVMDIDIQRINLPITPGKNITVVAEVIAMNYLLRHYGYDAAEAFQQKVKSNIAAKKKSPHMPKRAIEYFEGDIE